MDLFESLKEVFRLEQELFDHLYTHITAEDIPNSLEKIKQKFELPDYNLNEYRKQIKALAEKEIWVIGDHERSEIEPSIAIMGGKFVQTVKQKAGGVVIVNMPYDTVTNLLGKIYDVNEDFNVSDKNMQGNPSLSQNEEENIAVRECFANVEGYDAQSTLYLNTNDFWKLDQEYQNKLFPPDKNSIPGEIRILDNCEEELSAREANVIYIQKPKPNPDVTLFKTGDPLAKPGLAKVIASLYQ